MFQQQKALTYSVSAILDSLAHGGQVLAKIAFEELDAKQVNPTRFTRGFLF